MTIPSNYSEVEYIESTGSQQIDTGILFDMENDTCEVTFQSTVAQQNGMIFASNDATNHFWFYHYTGSNGIDLYIKNSGTQVKIGGKTIDTYKHTFKWKNKTYYLDEQSLGTDTRTLNTTSENIFLFSWNNNYFYTGRIFRCKIWKSGTLVREFVPVKNSSGVYGLYDIVNSVFYSSNTSTQFLGGPKSGYTAIEYIQSTGTQYINTNYYHNTATTRYEFTIMPISYPNTYHAIFGARVTHNGTEAYYLGATSSGSSYGCIGGNKMDPIGFTLSLNTRYTITATPSSGWTVNGTSYSQPYSSSVNSSDPCYIFGGNFSGNFSEAFYGRVYSFKIYEGNTLVKNYIPCLNSLGVAGLYEAVSDTFLTNAGTGDFNIPYSQAINAKSFCNYIVSLCTYFNGTSLSLDNQTQLYNYLIEGCIPSQLINIRTALAICNRVYYLMTGSLRSVSVSGGSLDSSLSYNSAKTLVDVVFPVSSGLRSKFCRLDQIYSTTNMFGDYNYMYWEFYLPATSSYSLKGTLIGGGGGGSGGQSHDGDKNSNYYTRAGGGANGGSSTLVHNGTTITASGGSGAGAWDAGPCGGNPNWSAGGSNGSNGSSQAVEIMVVKSSLSSLKPLTISPGFGGGGGGGFGCSASNSNDYRSSAVNASECRGSNGNERNSWVNDDEVFGGGGGEGGHGTGYTNTGIGSNAASGPANWGTRVSASYQSSGRGGRGGYTTGVGANTAQPNTLGAGGYFGKARNQVDESSAANGGNGGNAGGFVIDSSGSAQSALFIWRQ